MELAYLTGQNYQVLHSHRANAAPTGREGRIRQEENGPAQAGPFRWQKEIARPKITPWERLEPNSRVG